jgi:hypothetical protein
MKKLALFFSLMFSLSVMAQTGKKEPAVVILTAGQSNTDGRVDHEELPDDIRRDGYKYCQWSFGSGVHSGNGQFELFAPRIYNENKPRRWAYDAVVYYMLEKQLQRPFYVIKESLGGTAIDTLCQSNSNMHWSADPDYLSRTAASDKGGLSLLKAFTENIGACIDNKLSKLPEGYDIKAMLWHQGESDRSQADRYYDNLKAVVAYVRTYLVNKTGQQKYARLPFICGTFSKQSKQGSAKVVEAMLRLQREDPDFHVVDVSDATLQKDQIHFDAAGAELLGKRMYDCIQTNIKLEVGHQRPTMGWSSWNTYRVNISDSLIMQQADACVSKGLKEAGYTYINIDDGYFGGRDQKTGRLLIHPTRFPQGLKPVVEHIHGLGLKVGIYSDAGTNTCGSFSRYDNDTIARGVGLYGHDQQDADMFFKELGFDFIKIDFCGGNSRSNDNYSSLDPRERYTTIRQAIINTGRNDVRMNVCRWDYPGTWVNSIAQSWRMSHDISARWSSVKDIIQQNLYLSAYAKDGHYNDMDMLEVGRTLTAEEDRTHFGIWCIMSSPLLIGCDLTKLKPETLELLKNQELIALNQDSLGLQAYVAKHNQKNGTYVLVKDILQLHGLTRAVALYNPTDALASVSIDFADIELGGQVKVHDVFAHADVKLSKCASGLDEMVPAHGCRIYTLTASKRLPRKLYEAETAWLSAYQELYNAKAIGTAYYEKDSLCSGGMKVTNLGHRPDNDLQWQDVYVEEDGLYQITVKCPSFPNEAQLYIAENCEAGQRFTPKDSSDDNISVQLRLRKGQNTIRLYNDHGPMPEIDYLKIE